MACKCVWVNKRLQEHWKFFNKSLKQNQGFCLMNLVMKVEMLIIWFLLKRCQVLQVYSSQTIQQSEKGFRVRWWFGRAKANCTPPWSRNVCFISAHRCPPPTEASGILSFHCTWRLLEQHSLAEEFFKAQHSLPPTSHFKKSLPTVALPL